MTTLDDLLPLGWRDLSAAVRAGQYLPAQALAGHEYHGISLGNPRWFERLTWQTFKKVFAHAPNDGVRGWNVAVEQAGPSCPFVDRVRAGERVTYGHYVVRDGRQEPMPAGWSQGLILDYTQGGNPRRDPMGWLVKDPLVALDGDRLLLGSSYAALGPANVPLPFFFALVKGGSLTYEIDSPRAPTYGAGTSTR